MNLYQVMTKHYAQRGSCNGVWTYVVADSNESLYEYLKTEPQLNYDDGIEDLCLSWDYIEDDYEDFKLEMLEHCDEEQTSATNYNDLYYGKTFVSWVLVKENISDVEISTITSCGVRLCVASVTDKKC